MSKSNIVVRPRSNSLGLAFQDVITATVRVRYGAQQVANATPFRESIRKMLDAGAQETRSIGYGAQTGQLAQLAAVAFLDESVMGLRQPAFRDWTARPLQEEMFPGQPASEAFFRNLNNLLAQPESVEVADTFELYAICLLLGYRGKYTGGDDRDIQEILRRIRERLTRIRGPVRLFRAADPPDTQTKAAPASDPWIKRLALLAAIVFLAAAVAFAGYSLLLGKGLDDIQAKLENPVSPQSPSLSQTASDGGYER